MENNITVNIGEKIGRTVIDRTHPDIKRILRKRMVDVRNAIGDGNKSVVYDVIAEDVSPLILLNDFGIDFPEIKTLVFVRTSKRSCKKAVGFHLSPSAFMEMLRDGKTFWLGRMFEMTRRKQKTK